LGDCSSWRKAGPDVTSFADGKIDAYLGPRELKATAS
jgi:hypothetical protein